MVEVAETPVRVAVRRQRALRRVPREVEARPQRPATTREGAALLQQLRVADGPVEVVAAAAAEPPLPS